MDVLCFEWRKSHAIYKALKNTIYSSFGNLNYLFMIAFVPGRHVKCFFGRIFRAAK